MKIKQRRLFIDQHGNKFFAQTVKELRNQIGGGGSRVERMYRDMRGGVRAVGYVVGQHWLTEYAPVEVEVTR